MQWHRSGLIASWQFIEENPQEATEKPSEVVPMEVESQGVKRWGAMVILTSLHFLSSAVGAALRETGELSGKMGSSNGSSNDVGNVFHVALVGLKNQMSSIQDRYRCTITSKRNMRATLIWDRNLVTWI
jgi:acetyl-CoA carboxylase/biotin carboxylase 1